MSPFRVADLDLQTRSPKVELPARFPRIDELSFRLKAVRRRDVSSLLQLYWCGVKWLMIPCSDGADVIGHATRLFESAEKGVWPFSPLRPGLTFALRFDPRSVPGLQPVKGARPVSFTKWVGQFWDEINRHWSLPEHTLPGATANVEFEFTIQTNGSITGLRLLRPSGVTALDEAVEHAMAASQFAPLPEDFRLPSATMQVNFSYTGAPA